MIYSVPESNVYHITDVVHTSEFVEETVPGNTGSSGGIQLPFIPG